MEGDRKPMLLYFTGKTLNTHTFCSLSNPSKCYSTWNTDPEWRESKLLTVQHGWYVWENNISNNVSNLFLWNPCNLNKIILPPLQHNMFTDCILSSPPSAANHQTCSIYIFSSHSPSIFYYQLGRKQWTKVCFYNQIVTLLAMQRKAFLDERKTFFMNPVYCNGRVYARMCCIIVVIKKLHPNHFTINCIPDIMIKQPPTNFEELIISRLVECNNELFQIEIFKMRGRVSVVYVFKFDSTQQVWEKVESLKDKVFFVSSLDSAFACQAINPEEGGRIYIALWNYNYVFIYNIQDNYIVISQPFSNLSKKRSYSRWIMPHTGMAETFKEEIGKFQQIRENKSICDANYLKDAEDKANNVSVLSQDVVEVIAKHINDVLDYLHFRATNKFLRLAAPQIQWRSSSSRSRFDDRSMCPLFVFSKEKVFTFVNPKHGLKYKYNINFPQYWSLNSKICCSKDGWLLLAAVNNNIESQGFFNPFTKQVLPLPIGHKAIKNNRCVGMSHSPNSYECVTVEYDKVSSPVPMRTSYVHRLGDNVFGLFSFEYWKLPLCNVSPAFHNGSFYFLTITGKLAVLKVTREHYSWKQLEEPQAPFSIYFNNFLVECDGNLLAVSESSFADGVQVFKLNESTMTWVEVESLNNHMLFIGKTSFSAVASIPGMENKIYFPRFYDQSIVFYSLETNNYHTFQHHDQVVDFHHMREHLDGTWIQPRWD